METILQAWAKIQANIYADVLVLVLALGFGQDRFLRAYTWLKDKHADNAVKTLVLSLVVIPIYLITIQKEGSEAVQISKAIFTFVLATTLYDVLVRPFKTAIGADRKTRKSPKEADQPAEGS